MKEIVISIIIIVSIISLDKITDSYTKNSAKEIVSQLEQIKTDLKTGNINKKEIEKKYKEILNSWDEKFTKMAFYIEHNELEKVEDSITSMISYIESEEYNLALNEIAKNIFALNHIKDKYQLSLENIF